MKSRGRKSRVSTRLAAGVMGSTAVLAVLAMAWGGTAVAMPIGRQFHLEASSATWPATSAQGVDQSSIVTVDTAEEALGADLPDSGLLSANQHYLYVSLHPSYEYAGLAAAFQMPATSARLTTSGGTVTGIQPPTSYAVDASWYFPVPGNLTSATLQVAAFSKVLGNEAGDFISWSFSPTPLAFVGSAVPAASGAASPAGSNVTNQPAAAGPQAPSKGGGVPIGGVIGGTIGGVAILGVGGAGIVSVVRRRAFYKADREGRVVLSGPPPLVVGAAAAMGASRTTERHAIVVKLLGWLEIEGTAEAVTAGPVLELIVFLALNPGRSFTSVQLRDSIWGFSRQPITPGTFRKYMVDLRKAFGPGVVVTDKYRYAMTTAVTSDWDQFRLALEADDIMVGRDVALDLVRGPVLNGCFDGPKNGPFRWAIQLVDRIEDEVTTVAVELAVSYLELDDPQRAGRAVSQGLLCAETNTRLRLLDLRVGAALGGSREVGRRLQVGRAALATFPKDAAHLEQFAGDLGWSVAAT